jgi:hypothetical protein
MVTIRLWRSDSESAVRIDWRFARVAKQLNYEPGREPQAANFRSCSGLFRNRLHPSLGVLLAAAGGAASFFVV